LPQRNPASAGYTVTLTPHLRNIEFKAVPFAVGDANNRPAVVALI